MIRAITFALLLGTAACEPVYAQGIPFLSISEDNKTWHLYGTITPTMAQMLNHVSNNTPEPPDTLYITSNGGIIAIAMSIGEFVRQNDIQVIASGYCHSACSLIWLASWDSEGGLMIDNRKTEVTFHLPVLNTPNGFEPPSNLSWGIAGWSWGILGLNFGVFSGFENAINPTTNKLIDMVPIMENAGYEVHYLN